MPEQASDKYILLKIKTLRKRKKTSIHAKVLRRKTMAHIKAFHT